MRNRIRALLLVPLFGLLPGVAAAQIEPTEPVPGVAPSVSIDPHAGTYVNLLQGSATASYQTPAYYSADNARSLGLFYSSGMVSPTALVEVNVAVQVWPSTLSLQVRERYGSVQAFADGSQEIFFQADRRMNRLSGQLDVSALSSGAYDFEVVVREYQNDGTWIEADPVGLRVLVINAGGAPYGAGWSIQGLQHLVPTPSGVYVFEGDGTARWFAYPGTCVQGAWPQYCGYTTPAGDFSRLAKDTNTGGYVRAFPDGIRIEYAPSGRMTLFNDAGQITRYGYDGAGRLTSVTDPTGGVIQLGYDGAGKLAWVQDPSGRRVTTRVLASGALDQICDPLGCPFTAGYDARQRLAWRADRAGSRWDYQYDAFGKVSAVLSPAVAVDGQGTVRPATRFGSLESAVLPAPGTGTWYSPAPQVDPGDVAVRITDAHNNVTRIQVDRFGSPTRIEEPLGRITTMQRDEHGRLTRVTGFNGDVTEYTYLQNRPATIRDVTNGRTTSFTWQEYLTGPEVYPNGTKFYDYPLQVNTPGEATVRYERGGSGVYTAQVGATQYYHRDWDGFGRARETFGPGRHTLYFYAQSGAANTDSVMRISGVDTLTTRFVRDGVGRVVGTRDARGVESTAAYDALNRVQSTSGPSGVTSYSYASAGWLQTLTDPKNQQYVYTRNALGWLVSEQDPRGTAFSSTYDALGQMVSATNRRGQTVRYEHDALGRLVKRTTHEGAVTTYSSDPNGMWMAVQNAEAADTTRNIRGSPPSVEQITVRGGMRYVLNTRRDTVANSSAVTTNWGYGVTHHFTADRSGRIRELRDDRLALSTFIIHDDQLNRTVRVLPMGDSIIHGVRETRYTDPNAGGVLDRSYAYDPFKTLSNRGRPGVYTDSYLHDDRGQLNVEQRYDAAWQYTSGAHYEYDAAGNPTHAGAAVSTGNRLDAFAGYTLAYDADGNLTRKYKASAGVDWTYEWNSLGQLTSANGTSNGGASWSTITFGYDGSGRRVRKTVNGAITRYVYDGQHVLAETDGSGAVVREFIYEPGVDRPHSMRVAGQTFYYVRDHQGNVTGLVDWSGTAVNRYEYTPFGGVAVAAEGLENPLRFQGGRFDPETGLYFNRARYYDPELQRFISEDPLGVAGGLNTYSYAGNNPLNLGDPSGLNPCASWETLRDGVCKQTVLLVLPGVVVGGRGSEFDSDWYKKLYNERDYETHVDAEYAYLSDLDAAYQAQQDIERLEAAVQSTRELTDVGVGFIPGVSTVHDGSVALTGYNVVTGERVGLGGRGVALVGAVVPGVSGGAIRGAWELTREASSRIMRHAKFGTFYQHASSQLWWAVDRARHGGSAFKVFEGNATGLHWIKDADEFGDFLTDKHKGPMGRHIPWDELNGVP